MAASSRAKCVQEQKAPKAPFRLICCELSITQAELKDEATRLKANHLYWSWRRCTQRAMVESLKRRTVIE